MKYFDKYSPFDKKGSFTIASTETGVTPVGQESETFRHHREADTCKQHIISKIKINVLLEMSVEPQRIYPTPSKFKKQARQGKSKHSDKCPMTCFLFYFGALYFNLSNV